MKVNPTATSAQNRDVLRAGTLQTHTHTHKTHEHYIGNP